jgi:GNAT superfamily N-acetyltransferase
LTFYQDLFNFPLSTQYSIPLIRAADPILLRRALAKTGMTFEPQMKFKAHKAELKAILPLRNLFLQEANFQIRYNACHERGWSDSYLLTSNEVEIGYGSIKGQEIAGRDTIFEFYLIPPFKKFASLIFPELIAASDARFIECQSNDLLLASLLYAFAQNINSEVVLFEDHAVTEYTISGVVFRPRKEDDSIFEHYVEPIGEYVLELAGEVVATGGFMLHYNMPFADLYMEVKENFRRKGLGSFILQELKKACYLAGRVPAARCNIRNKASRTALLKAGMRVCGFMLKGEIKTRT